MFFVLILSFLVSKQCFLSFSTQNHAERSRNYLENSVLDPNRAKLHQNSDFGHVRTCQGQSRRTSPCQQSMFLFFFSPEITPFHFPLTNLSSFIKSFVSLSEFTEDMPTRPLQRGAGARNRRRLPHKDDTVEGIN